MTTTMAETELNTIFSPCRQCGTCCKQYRKITLEQSEVDFITKMGGYVGVDLSLKDIREMGIDNARKGAHKRGKIFMIHPDDKGCVFLQKRNDKWFCKIYHYRPNACQGFRCNMADTSIMALTSNDAILLLGQDPYGLPLTKK